MYNSCDTRYLRVLGQDPDLSYRAGNWRLNMGGEECFLLISGRHWRDLGNYFVNDWISLSNPLVCTYQVSWLLIVRTFFLYSATIKCPHLCAISHKIFMHHKILNGQEYKEKNAALCHYFVVVHQCIQNKILPNKKCIMSQIYLTCLQGYQGGCRSA